MKFRSLLSALLTTACFSLTRAGENLVPPKPASHTLRDLEGWTVHVDDRLLDGADKELGDQGLRLLANRLYEIKLVVPSERVARLQKVPIWLDRTHGRLRQAQYHPDAGWLKANGYDAALVKCVHIPDCADFASLNHQRVQPWSVLHELAHAYHDQVLRFDHAEIKSAWEKFRDSGKYQSVLHINGRQTRHYALTDQKEFFAEMTESFFGMNDFFPFNRAELQREEPEIFALLADVWGAGKGGSVRPVALSPPAAAISPAKPAARPRSEHWSFQSVKSPPLPGTHESRADVRNPVDQFVFARLETAGLKPSSEADRATLLRRLCFDLLGMPPSPAEIEAFIADDSPEAYERVVERLLASPRYGERWGRHWLDVARYTESQGFEYDKLRDNAWPYRDYVINSFNDDKPYDRFMKEQIAGDVLEPMTKEGMVGASLLVCGAWDEAGNSQANATQKAVTREEEMEDLVSVVGQTFLGLTINCARCHSHKFDPIPHEDYYRIKSVFEGVKHGERPIASAAELAAHRERTEPLKKRIAEIEKELSTLQDEAPGTPGREKRADREDLQAQIKKVRKALETIKPLPVSYSGTRVQPAPTRVLKRGDVTSPEEAVSPGGLSAIVDLEAEFGLAADAPEAERRLRFAAWLADARNPLPARVMANRIWHFHFGQGLVTTPNDFGASGARPSHPELLDWLAARFIESGWSVKTLHRLIVNSATYRQSSHFEARAATVDADNQLLWRFPPRRLEAEAARDAMLAAGGQINLRIGGPSFRSFDALKFPANAYVAMDKIGPDFNRRTVYRMNVNSGKEPLLDAFDCPDPSVKTPRRGVTTTPLQALALMNNSFVQRQAGHLAERAMLEASHDLREAVQMAYRLALGRAATTDEAARALAAARERSLASVCWALLNSTEFIYVR